MRPAVLFIKNKYNETRKGNTDSLLGRGVTTNNATTAGLAAVILIN
jgi:hypothetical protein